MQHHNPVAVAVKAGRHRYEISEVCLGLNSNHSGIVECCDQAETVHVG